MICRHETVGCPFPWRKKIGSQAENKNTGKKTGKSAGEGT